jgi:GntR family transcriptional regulator
VREAVRTLTADGLLVARQGQGTFVVPRPPIDSGLEELDTVTGMIERHGYKSGAAEIDVAVEDADAALADRLGVPAGTPLVRVERIRTADGDPVVLSRNRFPRALIDSVPAPEMLGGSLLAFLERRSGLRVVHAVTTLRPMSAGARLARCMRVRRGTPFLLFEQVHYAQDHRPCLYCEDYYRSDAFRFRILRRRRPVQSRHVGGNLP